MNTTPILLYSKYSAHCKRLLTSITDSPIVNMLQMLCIDNSEIRERIQTNNNIDIQIVPCILVIHPDGMVEKFESDKAFSWVNAVIQQITPPPPVQFPQEMPQTRPAIIQPPESDSENEVEYIKPKKKKKKKRKKKLQTSLAELDSDSEDDEYQSHSLKKPPGGIRSGEGGFDFDSDDFPDTDTHDRPTRKPRQVKETTSSIKTGGDVMTKMQEMMKERERDNSSSNRRMPVPTGRP